MTNHLPVVLHVTNKTTRALKAHPMTVGVPLREGEWSATDRPAVQLEDGTRRPVQSRLLQKHGDGSAAWLLLDFEIPLAPEQVRTVALVRQRVKLPAGLKVRENAAGVTVSGPHYTVRLSRKAFSLFESWKAGGQERMALGSDVMLETPLGKRYYGSNAAAFTVHVVECGPLRVVVEAAGRHTAGDGEALFDFRVRYTFRLSDPCVQLSYMFTNREMPETGVTVSRIALIVPTTLGRKVTHWLRQNNTGKNWFSRPVAVQENVEVLATKAVNEAAKARYGNSADGKIVIRNMANFRENPGDYPYYLRPGNARTDMTGGLRSCYPYIAATGEGGGLIGWFAEMDNHFPKGIAMDRNVMTFDVLPAWGGDLHVRRGQAKEHDLYIGLFAGEPTHAALEGAYFDHEFCGYGVWGSTSAPVEFRFDRDYAFETGVFDVHRHLRFDPDRYVDVEVKLNTYARGPNAPSRGMMDIGDSVTPDRSWSHNNENDGILGQAIEFLRRGDWASYRAVLQRVRHNAHVDFIAFDPDPLRQGTMPAHCPEHTDGATYPSHMWAGGLLAAYLLSGNEDFRAAAVSVGENMIRWQEQRPEIFYTDSRECGWPMLAWTQLYAHTRDRRWLKAARKVFEYYRDAMNEDGAILYDLPHGIGIFRAGYGEFVAWRAMFAHYELTREADVRDLLLRALPKVYRMSPERYASGGWACNDLFPAWAAYTLTGDAKFLEDNYPFLAYLMKQSGGFAWGGTDVHYYLAELDKRGALAPFCGKA